MNVPTSRHLVGGLVEPKFAHGKNQPWTEFVWNRKLSHFNIESSSTLFEMRKRPKALASE